ncbi:flagellar protein [Anaerosporobacter faecicola]|uniref:flagellar protein n=1 Tax=Anaerosporobacter faecicola TaxID=2718714 RepID=UPI00143A930C|nr:flagellar protein [Anaerosporobacter faecicola]
MDVRNCKDCGKLFNYIGGVPLCPTCVKKLDDKFVQVKEYIYDHPKAGVQEVSEENDVTPGQIRKWIREERLAFAEDSPIGLACESCGALIKTGRFCKQCKDKIANNLGNLYKDKVQEPQKRKDFHDRAKMRFLDN